MATNTEQQFEAVEQQLAETSSREHRYRDLLLKAGDEIRELRGHLSDLEDAGGGTEVGPSPGLEASLEKTRQELSDAQARISQLEDERTSTGPHEEPVEDESQERESEDSASVLESTIRLQRETIVDLRQRVSEAEQASTGRTLDSDHLAELQEELVESESIRDRQNKTLRTFAKVRLELESKVEGLEEALSEAQESAAEDAKALANTSAEFDSAAVELKESREKIEALDATLVERAQAMEVKLDELGHAAETRGDLESQSKALEKQVEDLQNDLEQISGLEEELANSEQNLARARKSHTQSVVRSEALEAQVQELKNRSTRMEKERDVVASELEESEGLVLELKKFEADSTAALHLAEETQAERETFEATLAEAQGKVASLEEELASHLEEVESKSEGRRSEIKGLTQDLEDANGKVGRLASQLEDLEEQAQKDLLTDEEAEARAAQLAATAAELKDEVRTLKAELLGAREATDEAKSRNTAQAEGFDQLEQLVRLAEGSRSSLEEDLAVSQRGVEHAEAKLAIQQEGFERLEGLVRQTEDHRVDLEAKLCTVNAEVSDLRAQLDDVAGASGSEEAVPDTGALAGHDASLSDTTASSDTASSDGAEKPGAATNGAVVAEPEARPLRIPVDPSHEGDALLEDLRMDLGEEG